MVKLLDEFKVIVAQTNRWKSIFTVFVFLIISHSLAQDSNPPISERIVSANTQFGFKLFSQLIKEQPGKNVFVSPTSISMALAMTYNGSQGSTKVAMARAMGLGDIDMEEVNASYANLLLSLNTSDSLTLIEIANSLWANNVVTFKDHFLENTKTYYRAEVKNLDFADPAASTTINAWVDRQTHGKIHGIVDKIESDVILFLVNAIYFKGSWSVKFNEEFTREKEFHLLNGNSKKVPMMWQSGEYKYLQGNNFQAVSLPYGNQRISMYVFLPDSAVELKEFYKNVNDRNWKNWVSEFRLKRGDIVLPRFKLENDFDLNDELKSIGMEVCFDKSDANFREMCAVKPYENVYISQVRHKTFVEVNEKGTEAAAATSVGMAITKALHPVESRFRMVVDRPFLCAIVDNKTKMMLFFGYIVEP